MIQYNTMNHLRQTRHIELSELTDEADNVYELTRHIAGVAKQIKEDNKEDTDPPNPVLKGIEEISIRS